ncbi:MAG: pyridoxal-phosphate-dependent aminotransferase family protein [Caldisericaceae bacterium]
MLDKEYLMIPGPTPLPPRVLAAMQKPMTNHRGPKFKAIFLDSVSMLKEMIKCKQDVFLIPSSGTGAMELAVENFTRRGDKVLVADTGFFGERFYKINIAHGRNAIRLAIPWGRAVEPQEILEVLKANTDIKAVFLTHNETSSTVINNIREISNQIKQITDAFIIVDGVSSIGIAEINMEEWNLDVVVAASQKGLMSPPGIGIVGVSKRALEYALSNETDAFYFSIKELKKNGDLGQPFTTFPVSDCFGLNEGLKMLYEEGLQNAYKRHELCKELTRKSIAELQLKFVADDADASPCVTGVFSPEGVNADEIVNKMREKYNVEIATTQGELKSKAFRVGHMGFINSNDILVTLAALESTLLNFGIPIAPGKSVSKFLQMRSNFNI